jgi:FMN phosphatase YigB (HAD superfamily)
MAIDWQRVKGIVFDFDGVFTSRKFMSSERSTNVFLGVSADVILRCSDTLDDRETIKKVHHDAFLEHHDAGIDMFCAHYGVQLEDFQEEFHIGTSQRFMGCDMFRAHIDDLGPQLRSLAQSNIQHGVLSAGHKEKWMLPIIKSQQWCAHFDHDLIYGLHESGYERKSISDAPFRRIANAMALKPEELVMVEDSSRNLVIPHRDLDMQTAWIHDGEPDSLKEDHRDFVHAEYKCVSSFLTDVLAAHPPRPQFD